MLYLAPWVDYGGTDKGTLDWFRRLDRERFAPSLILTQHPSPNRLLPEVVPYAEEVWNLPELMPGGAMPWFVQDFVHTRGIRVVHVMNSRLGFELIPDLCALPDPPAIVVQLHVEEDTRDGYVRYVTTRYGNLVDAFSVTSRHLAAAIAADYDVSPARCEVIYTGVDAEGEFSPEAHASADPLEDDRAAILYIGRLHRQKDPLLMVRVAAALRRTTEHFRIDVIGDGPLEQEVREAVRDGGLEDVVQLHGPTHVPASSYAAADVLLMTSVFEGIPYVLFEAMAMELPAVVPALPGNVEVLDESCGRLVEPRDDAAAYAAALAELIGDPALRRRLSRESRRRVLERYGLDRMAAQHAELYERLLGRRAAREQPAVPA